MPTGSERACLRLAIAHHAADQQIGIVKRRPVRVYKAVPEFASFVNRPRRLRSHVARNPSGKRKLLEEPLHPLRILRDVWIELAIRPFEVGIGNQAWPAMARASNV